MPELPEVETVCRGLAVRLEGRTLVAVEQHRPDLRFPLPARLPERLTGRRVVKVARRAKYILVHLDDGQVLLVHLGMTGRMVVRDRSAPAARHDHLVLTADDGTVLVFNDARRFGMIDLVAEADLGRHPALARLGPEPLGEDFTPAVLARALAGKLTPIKAALLDQRVVAGIGNIYACEALFFAGLSPRRLATTVTGKRAERLAASIRDVLERAIAAGGSSLRDYVQASGEMGLFQHSFAVYDRAGQRCPGCTCDPARTGGIHRIVQAGRSTFYCPVRQR